VIRRAGTLGLGYPNRLRLVRLLPSWCCWAGPEGELVTERVEPLRQAGCKNSGAGWGHYCLPFCGLSWILIKIRREALPPITSTLLWSGWDELKTQQWPSQSRKESILNYFRSERKLVNSSLFEMTLTCQEGWNIVKWNNGELQLLSICYDTTLFW